MPDKFPQNKKENLPRAKLRACPERSRRGQLLIEAMVAIGITVIGLIGIFSLLSQSFSLNKIASDQYIATNLAAEGIEVVKNMVDSNAIKGGPWNQGLNNGFFEVQYDSVSLIDLPSNNPRPLNFNPETGIYSYAPNGFVTNFKREIKIENKLGNNEIQVNSKVTWKGRGGVDFNVDLEEHFFNWR